MIWDHSQVAMCQYPLISAPSLLGQELLLDLLGPNPTFHDNAVFEASDKTCRIGDPKCQDHMYQEVDVDPDGYKTKTIHPAKYNAIDLQEVVSKCKYLSKQQQDNLSDTLSKFPKLFNGLLKKYKGPLIQLDLLENAVPSRTRAYPVPRAHLKVFKEELNHLVKIGVLEPAKHSEWIAGTFIIPKKDGRVRWITDFCRLNKYLKRKVYLLPKISDILARRTGYAFFTKLDISMQYYTFEMDEESKNLCTFATPFGLYWYCRLPMGVSESPDISTEIMTQLFADIPDIECYMDDIRCFSNDWKSHIHLLTTVLSRLQEQGFTINPL